MKTSTSDSATNTAPHARQLTHDVIHAARQAGESAMSVLRPAAKGARSFVQRHPQATVAVGASMAVLGLVGLFAWLRRPAR